MKMLQIRTIKIIFDLEEEEKVMEQNGEWEYNSKGLYYSLQRRLEDEIHSRFSNLVSPVIKFKLLKQFETLKVQAKFQIQKEI